MKNLTSFQKISEFLQKKFFKSNIRHFLQKFMKFLYDDDSRIPCLWMAAALAQAQ
jgi:hypothetical protein